VLLQINPQNPQPRLIQEVVSMLKQGAVVCYPTDTVYGIGCDIFNQKAVNRIYQIKRRPKQKPFSFMCSSLKNVSEYCHVSNSAYRLMKKMLPGPYTFILPALKIVPKIMLTKQKTVGIRVPDNPISMALVDGLGNPVLTTSAITADDDIPLANAYELEEKIGKMVDIIIDGGPIFPSPSSIVSLVEEIPVVLRKGKGDISIFQS
jgi:tRNA threonylcarbamoyl adenosine modification protein (Sua5/YciO/YrdC/YwlC family)